MGAGSHSVENAFRMSCGYTEKRQCRTAWPSTSLLPALDCPFADADDPGELLTGKVELVANLARVGMGPSVGVGYAGRLAFSTNNRTGFPDTGQQVVKQIFFHYLNSFCTSARSCFFW